MCPTSYVLESDLTSCIFWIVTYILCFIDCVDCDDIDRYKQHYIRPQKQYIVVQPQTECTDCGSQVVYQKPQQQVVYVQKPQPQTECTNCGTQVVYQKQKPQVVYIQKPQPQKVVYVTQSQTETCHGCETKPQVVYNRPKPQQQIVYITKPNPQPQTVYLTQKQTTCNNCGEKQPQKSCEFT